MYEKNERKTTSAALRDWTRRARADDIMNLRELDIIADRIDAELVELPKSADGKIWTGREECFWIEARGGAWSRHSLRSLDLIDGSRWYVRDTGGLGYEAGEAWHERPDSLERIAKDIEDWAERYRFNSDGGTFNYALDFADRIRKLAEREGER